MFFCLQFYLGGPKGALEDDMATFSGNFILYTLDHHNKNKNKNMFYDFTIRTKDNGTVPANKEKET
jgi:hypothetical protein